MRRRRGKGPKGPHLERGSRSRGRGGGWGGRFCGYQSGLRVRKGGRNLRAEKPHDFILDYEDGPFVVVIGFFLLFAWLAGCICNERSSRYSIGEQILVELQTHINSNDIQLRRKN